MIFDTESGSTYEVEHARKRIRRLRGEGPGTKRLRNDGQWYEYEQISEVRLGFSVYIYWGVDPTGELRDSTVTSHVTAAQS